MQIFCAAVSLYHSWMHRGSSTSLHWHLFYAFLYVLMLFIPSICTVYPLSCHMVSMSWNDHSLLMQCPGRVQAVSRPCPGHVQQAVHLKLFWTCSRRTFATKLCRLIFSSTKLVLIVKAMPMVPWYSDFVSRFDNIVKPVAKFVCIIALRIALVRALFLRRTQDRPSHICRKKQTS